MLIVWPPQVKIPEISLRKKGWNLSKLSIKNSSRSTGHFDPKLSYAMEKRVGLWRSFSTLTQYWSGNNCRSCYIVCCQGLSHFSARTWPRCFLQVCFDLGCMVANSLLAYCKTVNAVRLNTSYELLRNHVQEWPLYDWLISSRVISSASRSYTSYKMARSLQPAVEKNPEPSQSLRTYPLKNWLFI